MKRQGTIKPGYLKVHDELKLRILSGEWKLGEQIPTERELEKEFGLSRLTISKGLVNLVNNGLLKRHPGRGTFVAYEGSIDENDNLKHRLIKFILPLSSRGEEPIRYGHLAGVHDVFVDSNYEVGVDFYKSIEDLKKLLRRDEDAYHGGFIVFYQPDVYDELYRLQQKGFPFVSLDAYPEGLDTDYVVTDNTEGGRLMVEHLMSLGHQRITYVTRPIDRTSLADRLSGFLKGMVLADITFSSGNIVKLKGPQSNAVSEVIPAVEAIINSRQAPSAIAFSNDDLALEALAYLKSSGIDVPNDVSIIGYDNIDRAEYGELPLTTVAQDFYQMGRFSAEILLHRLQGKASLWPQHILLKPQLIVRESTTRARDQAINKDPAAM